MPVTGLGIKILKCSLADEQGSSLTATATATTTATTTWEHVCYAGSPSSQPPCTGSLAPTAATCVYSFSRVVMTKYHRVSGLEPHKCIVSQFWTLQVRHQNAGRASSR
ncbi:hypothetical protein AAY473_008592 [Plecturocebus cupreus]